MRELESDAPPTTRVYERFKWLRDGYSSSRQDVRKRVRAPFRLLVCKRWKFVHTNAMGIAYLLDPNTDPNTFIDTDEADRSNNPRTGMLDRLNVTRTQIIGYLYSFAIEKRAWPPEDKRNNEGEAPRHWWESHRAPPHTTLSFTWPTSF
ncbi:hypothetical protein GQ600_25981 [Phytophthora cactorum]|nr:hypothetical protein GQ600_25981 [Phytophthora cactorum]